MSIAMYADTAKVIAAKNTSIGPNRVTESVLLKQNLLQI